MRKDVLKRVALTSSNPLVQEARELLLDGDGVAGTLAMEAFRFDIRGSNNQIILRETNRSPFHTQRSRKLEKKNTHVDPDMAGLPRRTQHIGPVQIVPWGF